MPAIAENEEVLTDVILEGLIGETVDVTYGGVVYCDACVLDVSKRMIWVKQPSHEAIHIKLSDILSISHTEKIRHHYRNPNTIKNS